MSAFYAILLGIIQGITEFLPVSSYGHSCLLRQMWGISGDFGTLFSVFLHMGTLIPVILLFHKDIILIICEIPGLLRDLYLNFRIYCRNRHSDKPMPYIKIITRSSRKLAMLVFFGTIPTFFLGYTAQHLVFIWSLSAVWPSIGFLMTGIVLLVADLGKPGGKKSVREAAADQAMWIGICQGLSVFPGVSRFGLTYSAGLLFGYSGSYAVKYSYLLSIPAVLGALFCELSEFSSPKMEASVIAVFLGGMIVSACVGFFSIRFLFRLLRRIPLRFFAYYCFLVGICTLVMNFL